MIILSAVQFFLTPSHAVALLLGLGVLALLLRRLRRLSIWLFVGGTLLLFVFGSGPIAYYLLGSLEFRYPALHSLDTFRKIDTIVVLSGYAASDNIYPVSSRVNDATIFRLSEAVRLWREKPSARLLLAGLPETTAAMKNLLVAMGIPEGSVISASSSRNTAENVESLKSALKRESFVLITSAGHMPRAVLLFTYAGLHPIPAPTDFYTFPNIWNATLFPTPFHLRCSDLAIHEHLALLYYRLKGLGTPNPGRSKP